MYKIIHYRGKCIGCGVCYELQPELWRMSKKDGKARLLKGICKKNIYKMKSYIFIFFMVLASFATNAQTCDIYTNGISPISRELTVGETVDLTFSIKNNAKLDEMISSLENIENKL